MSEQQGPRRPKAISSTPATFAPDDIREWIEQLCDALDITPTFLAKKARIAPSTLNKFLNKTAISKNLSGSTMMSISIAVVKMIQDEQLDVTVSNLPEIKFDHKERASAILNAITVEAFVNGIIGYGLLQKSVRYDDVDQNFFVTIPRSLSILSSELFGYELREEGNVFYPNGSIIICTKYNNLDFEPNQKLVLIKRREDGMFEGTIFQFVLDPASNGWLAPAASEARPDEMIFLGRRRKFESDELEIALVVATIRPEA